MQYRVLNVRTSNSAMQKKKKKKSDHEFVFPSRHCWEERMTSWGKDNQPHLTASKLCEANPTGVRLAHVSMGSDTGPGQPVTHKMLTFPTLFSLSPSLLRNYSSLKYVCTVCICMYVQNLTVGLEHINQKRWAIPHCVLESYIIFASWVRRDKPGSSLFIWSKPTVRARWRCQRTTATAPTCWHSRLGDA